MSRVAVSADRALRYNGVMRSFATTSLVYGVCLAACTGGSLPEAARHVESGEDTDALGQEGDDAGSTAAVADAGSDGPSADAAEGPVARDAGLVRCDPREALCNRAPPSCAEFEAPSVLGGCYGPCVRIERCACEAAANCPDEGRFTCHLYAKHCGPYTH